MAVGDLFLHGGVEVSLEDSLGVLKLGLHDAHLHHDALLESHTHGLTREPDKKLHASFNRVEKTSHPILTGWTTKSLF